MTSAVFQEGDSVLKDVFLLGLPASCKVLDYRVLRKGWISAARVEVLWSSGERCFYYTKQLPALATEFLQISKTLPETHALSAGIASIHWNSVSPVDGHFGFPGQRYHKSFPLPRQWNLNWSYLFAEMLAKLWQFGSDLHASWPQAKTSFSILIGHTVHQLLGALQADGRYISNRVSFMATFQLTRWRSTLRQDIPFYSAQSDSMPITSLSWVPGSRRPKKYPGITLRSIKSTFPQVSPWRSGKTESVYTAYTSTSSGSFIILEEQIREDRFSKILLG
ncbi:hypothetical protein MKZ38_008688 [Zalerion maritima]|uniref:Uncharacterized protein n=1 Tax=Zalerion maritima TaxID=339359 RepID=A0AAD5RHD7_9PEZI|nr:hypothetical protein MKZ38_008688 [Zalerion maritima]